MACLIPHLPLGGEGDNFRYPEAIPNAYRSTKYAPLPWPLEK